MQSQTPVPLKEPRSLIFPSSPVEEPVSVKDDVKAPLLEPEIPKRVPSKSTSGPPVYYPPNHEMFNKKDAPITVITKVY